VWTAARERSATGSLAKAYQASGFQMANSDAYYTGWDGGVPVLHGGQVVGAVAVSGLTQEEDAELARLGAARIAESFTG
jgi:glc operon protein GlcG